MILTKLEREKQTSFGKTSSYNYIIISMIILNTNYETIMSLCRKVQIVLQINSQSRQNYKSTVKLYKKNIVSIEKIDIYCTNMFLFPPIIDTIIIIEVTNSLLCRHTQ